MFSQFFKRVRIKYITLGSVALVGGSIAVNSILAQNVSFEDRVRLVFP